MQPKIIDYKILSGNDMGLQREVQDFIKEGWQPYGNPFDHGSWIYQAVVKYEQKA